MFLSIGIKFLVLSLRHHRHDSRPSERRFHGQNNVGQNFKRRIFQSAFASSTVTLVSSGMFQWPGSIIYLPTEIYFAFNSRVQPTLYALLRRIFCQFGKLFSRLLLATREFWRGFALYDQAIPILPVWVQNMVSYFR